MTTYRIGRHAENDVAIDDATISRHHAEITVTADGRFRLADLGSTNGTYVRQEGEWAEIESTYVEADEIIMLGDYATTPAELLGSRMAELAAAATAEDGAPDDGEAAPPARPRSDTIYPRERSLRTPAPAAEIWRPRGAVGRRRLVWAGAAAVAALVLGVGAWIAYRQFMAPSTRADVAPAPPVLTWERSFGGAKADGLADIRQTPDGGFVAVGATRSQGAGEEDAWIVRLDGSGEMVWEKTFGRGRAESSEAVWLAADGSYVLAGSAVFSRSKVADMWLLTVAADGKKGWEKRLRAKNEPSDGLAAQDTADGGYVIAGTVGDAKKKGRDVRVVKLNAKRRTSWDKTFGGKEDEQLAAGFRQTADGGFIGAGTTASKGNGETDAWAFKLDPEGEVAWERTFGGAKADGARAIGPTRDGGHIVAGFTVSQGQGREDMWVFKLDPAGAVVWEQVFGTPAREDAISVIETADGGYLVLGSIRSDYAGDEKLWLIKLDGLGEKVWERTYEVAQHGWPGAVRQTADGGFVIAGKKGQGAGKPTLAWVMKLDAEGQLGN